MTPDLRILSSVWAGAGSATSRAKTRANMRMAHDRAHALERELDQGPMACARGAAYRRSMKRTLALLVLAGCASTPQWQKDGATSEAVAADMKTCEAQAPIEPRVQGTRGMPSGIGGESKAAFNTMAEREGDRMQKDGKFIAECMRGK